MDDDAETPSDPASPGKREPEEDDFASQEHESSEAEDDSDVVSEDAEETTTSDEAKPASRTAADDDVVEVKVGEDSLKLSVRELKRLAGQEAALNRKSEAVAEQRKTAELKAAFLDKKLNAALEHAEKRWKEYEGFDMSLAAADLATGKISDAQYHAIKAEIIERYSDYENAQKERREFLNVAAAEKQHLEQQRVHAAVQAIRADFGDETPRIAEKLEAYADSIGLSKEEQIKFLHPALFKMMNKARLYDEAKANKPEIKKMVAEPAKVLKPQTASGVESRSSAQEAMRKASRSGSMDDAVAALLAIQGKK